MAYRIVVGVDGSPHSEAALRWACEEAGRWGASVRAVYVYSTDHHLAELARVTPLDVVFERREQLEEEAQRRAEGFLHTVLRRVAPDFPEVVVAPDLIASRQPAKELARVAEGADLLVVGSRGMGGFAGLVLGSVSQQCAQHSPCPVTIVPSGRSRRR
jgi:nucleotide-binding universal stress UspA family protein